MSFEVLPDEMIVEMMWLVPRAYGHLSQLNKRCKGIVAPHLEWAKTASCAKVTAENIEYWVLPNGQRHGKYKSYFDTGDLGYEATYVDGMKHGNSVAWDKSGHLCYKFQWVNNEFHGENITYLFDGATVITRYNRGKCIEVIQI
ncbi:hypothetical protein F-LCD7_0508 [Faustovirus]|nr:hypothetical protein F-LCD7_0508 [Faustovirus]QJX73261.1 hypothetical protein F-VV57_0500 [Faustovirus]QJX73768.1 hypothetical protein F-VV63_0502 [Faustovirus]